MSVQMCLERKTRECRFVPLAVLGYCLTRSGLLQPLWSQLDLDLKTFEHTPTNKLQDVLVAILAGCRSLAQVNTRLRPETVLAAAWHRSQFSEQSNLSRTLDALQDTHIQQLRNGHLQLWRQHTQLRQHHWSEALMLDVDPTSLVTSKHAEGSHKGWVSGKKTRTVVMSCVSPWRAIMKAFYRSRMQGIGTVTNISSPPSSIC